MSSLNMMFVGAADPVGGERIGYGRLGVNLAAQLRADGHTVYDHLPEPTERDRRYAHWNKGEHTGVGQVVCWVSTPGHANGWYSGQIPCLFSMWEATILPECYRETLDNFDVVVVPSQQNVELFSTWHPNVRYVPLGVDPAVWHYTPRPPADNQFRFLIGGSGRRKGGDAARQAFRFAFPTDKTFDPDPTLVVKTPKGDEYGGPRIEIVTGYLSAEEEVALYASAHCYLGPSRGEGFGLQPLQALAQGIPTILTGAHGHESFMHLGLPIGTTMEKADYFIYGDAGEWWNPNVDELVDRMRWVYDNYEMACAHAKGSAEVVARDWTWKHTADAFLDALGRDRLVDYTGPMTWREPDRRRYLTILNTGWEADMAGARYVFRKGERYWETADVKRVLFEAGLLDPECVHRLPGDSPDALGLAEHQLEQLGDYTAARSWCPTCGQKLNSGIQRRDVEFEALAGLA